MFSKTRVTWGKGNMNLEMISYWRKTSGKFHSDIPVARLACRHRGTKQFFAGAFTLGGHHQIWDTFWQYHLQIVYISYLLISERSFMFASHWLLLLHHHIWLWPCLLFIGGARLWISSSLLISFSHFWSFASLRNFKQNTLWIQPAPSVHLRITNHSVTPCQTLIPM